LSLLKKFSATAAVVAAAGVLVATEAQATEGYFQNAIGARHKGIAGAGVADGKDATIINLNPAGLVHAGRQFNGSISLFMPFREYSASAAGGPGPFNSVLAPGTVKSGRNIFAVPNLAYSHPLDEDRTIGFSLSGNGGMNTSYRNVANTAPNCFGGTGVFCGGGKTGVDLTQLNISAAYAQKLGDHFSFGVSPIFAIQRFKARGLGAFAINSSDPANLTNRGYDYSFGGGVRLGVEFALDESIRIGASYQSQLLMSKFDKYAGLFAQQGDFDIPSNFQVGVAFDVTPDLTFMVDYRYINYSEIKAVSNPNPNGLNLLGTSNGPGFGWKDVQTIKFGAEYNATEDLTVRAGYSYNTQPIPSSQVLFNVLAPATVRHHITGGATYKYSPNSEFEFAAMFAPSVKVSGATGAVQTSSIKMHQVEVTVGYNYHWN